MSLQTSIKFCLVPVQKVLVRLGSSYILCIFFLLTGINTYATNVFEDYQSNIRSLSFTFEITERWARDYIDVSEPDKNLSFHHKTLYDYKSEEGKFYFKAVQKNILESKSPSEVSLVAYNGIYFQNLEQDGTLTLTQKKDNLDELYPPFGMKNSLYEPFRFLVPRGIVNFLHVDHPWLIKLDDRFKSFLERAKLRKEEVKVGEWSCLVYSAPFTEKSVENPLPTWATLNDLEIIAYLAKDQSLYPIKWQLSSPSRGVLCEYEVKELATVTDKNGKKFLYAKKAIYSSFYIFQDKFLHQTEVLQSSEVKKIQINDHDDLEDFFTIDVAQAVQIYDIDAKIGIRIPK